MSRSRPHSRGRAKRWAHPVVAFPTRFLFFASGAITPCRPRLSSQAEACGLCILRHSRAPKIVTVRDGSGEPSNGLQPSGAQDVAEDRMGRLIERFQVANVEVLFQHQPCKVVEKTLVTAGADHERLVVP